MLPKGRLKPILCNFLTSSLTYRHSCLTNILYNDDVNLRNGTVDILSFQVYALPARKVFFLLHLAHGPWPTDGCVYAGGGGDWSCCLLLWVLIIYFSFYFLPSFPCFSFYYSVSKTKRGRESFLICLFKKKKKNTFEMIPSLSLHSHFLNYKLK